ncbi:hypothetical protein [Coralloluteibacterium thermophilus]|uniref:IPTL-CTERM sorting domain-containing protein n=1 Tax=Coralloluteibacterium thermophilum TaxID=2707049 RepID=A0ABV9NQ84_9GAMM
MAQVLVPYCRVADFDAATGTCAAPFWGPHQGVLPPLTMVDASLIAAGIISLWAIGFIIRQARRAGQS